MLKKRPRLIGLFAWGLILTSLGQMTGMGWQRYIWLFKEFPLPLLYVRYAVTWSLRILGLLTGIGLLYRKDVCRRLGMGICWFTVLTIGLKHTHYPGWERHLQNLVRIGGVDLDILEPLGISYPALIWIMAVTASLLDVLFAVCYIFYFRKADVRAVFH